MTGFVQDDADRAEIRRNPRGGPMAVKAETVYETVESWAAKGLTRRDAITKAAEELGMKRSATEGGFYRYLKARDGQPARPSRARVRAPERRPRSAGEDELDAAVAQLAFAVAHLQEVLAARRDTLGKIRAVIER